MTKKHFSAIANILRDANTSDGTKEDIGEALADFFKSVNPKFDRRRFMAVVNNED